MTRLDAIKRRYPSASTMRRLARQIPDVTALDLEWLLAQVEALATALRDIKAIVGTPHPATRLSRVCETAAAALAAPEEKK